MIVMPKIFSDNALYLHSSRLELRGRAEADQAVSVALLYNDKAVASACGMSDGQGDFCVEIRTPAASFKEYTVRVTSGDDAYEFGGVLFGELWLACGQSNMEMPNNQQPEWETEVSDVIKGKKLRFFNQPKPACGQRKIGVGEKAVVFNGNGKVRALAIGDHDRFRLD